MKQVEVGTDVYARYLTGGHWKANRNTRTPSSETGEKRKAKRSRLGNATLRKIYIHAKGYKHPEYRALCHRADLLTRRK